MIQRTLHLESYLRPDKVLILYGPRQVGKTTLLKHFLSEHRPDARYRTGDDLVFANDVGSCDLRLLRSMVEPESLFAIDEAQKIPEIGRALKLIVDNIPGVTVIVTGSSSFDLTQHTGEALTGRKTVCMLYPISLLELLYSSTPYDLNRRLPELLVYGMYPEVVSLTTAMEKSERLREIAHSYLLKDILMFESVKSSRILLDLLRLVAFQIGSELSTTEISRSLGIDKNTVSRYLDLLVKSFVLVRLGGFSRNLRKEISKMHKYYFMDVGIRNALIANLNPLNLRDDVGRLWENFMIIERIKKNSYARTPVNYYFWRTYDQKEIDLIEESGGTLHGWEFKWSSGSTKAPRDWLEAYPNGTFDVVTPDSCMDFVRAD